MPAPGEPHNHAPRPAKLPLQRLNFLRREMKMLLEKPFQNVHLNSS
jgi:hypothetical protein